MKNADLFKNTFGMYATEIWSMPENDFLKWLNEDAEPKTGHWIEKYGEDGCGERYSCWVCSECGRDVGFNLANIEDVLSEYPFCHCGAKMYEPQESEET